MTGRRTLVLEVSSLCRAGCVFCGHPRGAARSRNVMPPIDIEEVIGQAADLGFRELHPQFWGEPSTAKFCVAQATEVAHGLEMLVVYYTNGSDLPVIMPDHLIFSIDYHDADLAAQLRPGLDFDEVRENVLEYWDRVRDLAPFRKVSIRCTACPENREHLDAIVQAWRPYCHHLAIEPEAPAARPVEDWKVSDRYRCDRPAEQTIILSTGEVVLCCCDWKGKHVLGKFPDQTLREILESDRARELRGRIHRRQWLPICNRCGFRNRAALKGE